MTDMVFTYYPGCTLSTTGKALSRYALLSAEVLGFGLEEIDDWQCCGAVFPLGSDEIAPMLPVIRALRFAGKKNRPLVTLCAACHHVFKQVNFRVRGDSGFRESLKNYFALSDEEPFGYEGETEVLHFVEALRKYIGFETVKSKAKFPLAGRKIGAYYGCMLLRPGYVMEFDDPENPSIFEDMIRSLGAEPVPFPYRNECCGGYHSLTDKQTTKDKSCSVSASAASRGADSLITACPLCEYNTTKFSGGELPVLYFTELLAQALGVKDG